jgi:hypothetical protein
MDFETLAARALNASRTIHKPTYAGLRILVPSLAKNKAAFKSFLARRCLSRASWRYISFEIVKEASKNKAPTYRNCITGSPLTTLAEAHVLDLMAGQAAFAVPPCAYSYLWPDGGMSGRSFEHFIDGYERRNVRVAELLSTSPGHVAVVTDIKSFYPSVDRQRLREKVAARAGQIQNQAVSGPIRKFTEALLSQPVPRAGIPIGPDLSHALGHLALESVDRAMMEKYGERYLRYVDDVIIVCPKSEAADALANLRQALAAEGLTLNEEKEDQVERATWERECVSFSTPVDGDSFESLLEDITVFLIFSPQSADALHKRFRDEGFSLPISRLRSLARSKRYRAHFRGRLSGIRGLWAWMKSWFATEASLVEKARSLRRRLLAEAGRLAEGQPPSTPMRRRWYAQQRRYVLNRLLYLLPPQEMPRLLPVTPDIDEFVESRVVMEALRSGDATNLLKYPGRVVSTFCQLWPEHHLATRPQISWPKTGSRADAESATHLGLFLSVIPPKTYLRSLEETLPGYSILIDICATGAPDRGKIERLSFLDELDLLYSTIPHEELVGLVASRFDELEDVGLEGLHLGGGGYLFSWESPYSA